VAAGEGLVIVAGQSENAAGKQDNGSVRVEFLDVLVRAYDQETGGLVWEDRIDPAGGRDLPTAVAVGRGIAVVGGSFEVMGRLLWFVRAYNPEDGRLLWEDASDRGAVFQEVGSLALQGDQVIATGIDFSKCSIFSGDGAGCYNITRAYDARTGALRWEDKFEGAGILGGGWFVTSTANVVIVGGNLAISFQQTAFIVRALDAQSGAVLWHDQMTPSGAQDRATQVAAHGNRVFAIGGVNHDWMVRAYHAHTGKVLWEKTYSLAGSGLRDVFDYPLQVATEGTRVVVAGYGSHPSDNDLLRDWVVNAYDANDGELRWTDVLDPIGRIDEAGAGVIFEKGLVFVHGFVAASIRPDSVSNDDMLIRAYDPGSGRLVWEDQIDKENDLELPAIWPGLAADRGRVTIVGSTVHPLPDGSIESDWVVRTYRVRSGAGGLN
jgi:outer membrane protein assembly factor BamB